MPSSIVLQEGMHKMHNNIDECMRIGALPSLEMKPHAWIDALNGPFTNVSDAQTQARNIGKECVDLTLESDLVPLRSLWTPPSVTSSRAETCQLASGTVPRPNPELVNQCLSVTSRLKKVIFEIDWQVAELNSILLNLQKSGDGSSN